MTSIKVSKTKPVEIRAIKLAGSTAEMCYWCRNCCQ